MDTINDKIVGNPEDETNLCFILEMTPNVFTIVREDEKDWVYSSRFKDTNIQMKCKYLSF